MSERRRVGDLGWMTANAHNTFGRKSLARKTWNDAAVLSSGREKGIFVRRERLKGGYRFEITRFEKSSRMHGNEALKQLHMRVKKTCH